MSHEIRQQVTNRILKPLAAGLVPWGRPWLGHRNDGPPTKALTSIPFRAGRQYHPSLPRLEQRNPAPGDGGRVHQLR
jgi:hypothetical protein